MSGIKVVLVVEEMHMHASRKKMSRFDMGEPVMVRVMRQGQNFSISCVAIEQCPSLLDSAILANVATRIVMRLTNYPCVSAIGHSMGLTGPQRDELVELPERRALVQTWRSFCWASTGGRLQRLSAAIRTSIGEER